MSILTNKMPNLTENAKVLILSKLEEAWSIRRVAQDYKASFSWWLYKRGSLSLETARPMGAQLLKNAAAWLGLC
jgi:hypothetical protein